MSRTKFSIVTALVGATVWAVGTLAPSQDSTSRATSRQPAAATASSPSAAEVAPTQRSAQAAPATKPSKFRGRLPAYFAKVVTEQQRKQIYGIQEEYFERINALKAQLEALIQEQDEKINAVLSEEQRQQVEKMKEAAKGKRQANPAE